ncbi:MAG: DegV family protein [Anaerolineales bacterium]|nr:DegV family protein [Anaerolineales bacterium]MCX7755933.1 DegV family protein [Anaerolineales bacterium]MDW8276881.1 DegV family protein [Anaerolineales bacterium]
MKIGLVTDSPADLPPDLVEQYGIEVIPALLIIDGREYVDGVDMTREQFYARLPVMRQHPTTAAPSPLRFAACYEKLLANGCEHILSIHTAEKLTSLTNFARQAAREFDGRVTVLESGSLTLGTGFQVLAAAEAIEQGAGLETVLERVRSTRQRVRVAAALDTMDYLRRSGRVPAAITTIGGLLSIKPVVELREGAVRPISAARTTRQAAQALLEFLVKLGPLERLAILHTNAETRAHEFLTLLMNSGHHRSLPPEIRLVNVTGLIGAHVGPNGLGIAAVQKENG